MNENIFGLGEGDNWVKSLGKWAMCVFASTNTREKCAALKTKWHLRPTVLGFNPAPIWAC